MEVPPGRSCERPDVLTEIRLTGPLGQSLVVSAQVGGELPAGVAPFVEREVGVLDDVQGAESLAWVPNLPLHRRMGASSPANLVRE